MLASSVVDRGLKVKPKTMKLVFVASLLIACNIQEKQQILLDGSESGKCVGVERHVYPQTVVSVSFK